MPSYPLVKVVLFLLGVTLAMPGCVATAPIEGSQCNNDHPCPSGFACLAGQCSTLSGQIVIGCTDASQCPHTCLEEVGTCVQCTQDSECLSGRCLLEAYACGPCDEDEQCATGRCIESTGVCASCQADFQCHSGNCDEASGVCDDPEAK